MKPTKEIIDKRIFSLNVWEDEEGAIQCHAESRIRGGDVAVMVAEYLTKNTQGILELLLQQMGSNAQGENHLAFDSLEEMDKYDHKGNKIGI